MKTTIIYIRVSTSQQAENGLSLENQLKRLREYCKYHGFQNIIEISDEGISGKSTNRPGFQKMIELAKKHQIDNVIVYSLSRFARNTIDTIKTMNLFNKLDVSFHSITESLDTSTAIGRFFISTLASLSQLEREQIGERTKSVLQMKKIEDDFWDYKKIIRCHKSYFVNLSKVKTTSGNARALYLHINELDFQIPVSRNFSNEIVLGTN